MGEELVRVLLVWEDQGWDLWEWVLLIMAVMALLVFKAT